MNWNKQGKMNDKETCQFIISHHIIMIITNTSMLWVYGHYKYVTLSVWGSTVRFWRLKWIINMHIVYTVIMVIIVFTF